MKMNWQTKFIAVATAFLILGCLFIFPQTAEARSFEYDSYKVDMQVNADSTVDVTETLSYRFDGEFRGVFRKLTLVDRVQQRLCNTSGRRCGGFERVALLGVYDGGGRKLNTDEYTLAIEEDEDNEVSYFAVTWEVWPSGKLHSPNQVFTWQVRYRLYGSLGWLNDASDPSPYLYWNALPQDRGATTREAEISITLPGNSKPDLDNLEVFEPTFSHYDAEVSGKKITITTGELPETSDLTIAYRLDPGEVDYPGTLLFNSYSPWLGLGVKIDDVDLGTGLGGEIRGFPTGEHKVEFYFSGYESQIFPKVEMNSDDIVTLGVSLNPTPMMWTLLLCNILLNAFGLIIVPLVILRIYRKWRAQGRDQNMPSTIIPLYKPPAGVAPYLLGSLSDEKVDRQDITGTIIDLAYRGFIHIKEIDKGKEYELTKLEGKPDAQPLNAIESEIIHGLFYGQKSQVNTKKIGTTFALKYPFIVNDIYDEMVKLKYFERSPQAIRNIYYAKGVVGLLVGIGLTLGAVLSGFAVIGFPGPVLLGLALLAYGIANMVVAEHMPAKTPAGSKVYAEILGFKMYMYTAERYRVQNLQPEDFERYLSYAIVFGIEKQWAEKFKDIYKGQPEWYEGDSTGIWDAYWLSNFTRSFSDSVNSTVFSSGTGSGSGGGWSGGGGGGFSGGGGGGGSSGAF